MYADVDLIIDGALEHTVVLHTQDELALLGAILDMVQPVRPCKIEAYVVWHDHSEGLEECTCVQYLTDHQPYYSRTWDASEIGTQ